MFIHLNIHTVKPLLRRHLWNFLCLFKRGVYLIGITIIAFTKENI
jgi:hypothetical protein